jgi:hypothetical protein
MGKGSSQAPADSTMRQTNLPEYADPYFARMLQGAEEALMPFQDDLSQPIYDDAGNITGFGQKSTYQPYQGERIAPSSMYGDIQGARSMVRGLAETPIAGLSEARSAITSGLSDLKSAGEYSPGTFSEYGGFEQYEYRDPLEYSKYEFTDPTAYSQEEVEKFMSPYIGAVLERQKEAADLDYQRQRAARDARAVSANAFGGSRQAVQGALAEESLLRQMGDIEAIGRQQAFEQGVGAFRAEREMQMEMDARRAQEQFARESAQAAEYGFYDQARAAEAARLQAARAAEAARVQRETEQSRQFGAGQSLAAAQAGIAGAGQLANLGFRQRGADIQSAQMLETIGRDVRAEDQARLDLAYEDFQRQRDYPITQYERMAGILRGVPVTPDVEQQRMVSYNPTQQALGAGISALGLYKGLSA